ncbi:MAG: hypothetical protein IRZ16_05190 [Myxococcaceae bacterium]|nr:hypothetical protein [Myxococcaceae bacterium]
MTDGACIRYNACVLLLRRPSPALVLLLAAIACGPPPPPPGPPAFEPFSLADGERHEVTLTLDAEGEAVLALEGELDGVAWRTANAESVTIEVIVDRKVRRHLIWTDTPAGTHRAAVGRLGAGDHTVRLTRVAEQTRAHEATLRVTGTSLTLSPEQTLARFAPILLGREDSAFTDVPLILYGHERSDGALEYTVVFSNEDGGTGAKPKVLVAEWGRLSDIEWALTVERDADGNATARTFQGIFHGSLSFAGPMEGEHALLNVATNNGVFADDGEASPFRIGLPVVAFEPGPGRPREAVVDDVPGAVALIDDEGMREGKIDPACADPSKVWLAKCYAYVDVTVSASAGLGERRLWGLEARTERGDVFRSEADLGQAGRLNRTGQVRVAIPVGPDQEVAEVRAYFVDDGEVPIELTFSAPILRRWTGSEWKVMPGDETVVIGGTTDSGLLWP